MLGHEVRLIPPIYVKPFVKRQKNDAAEAICEAAQRPSFAAVKTEQQQGMLCGIFWCASRRSTLCGVTWRSLELWLRRSCQSACPGG